MPMILNSPMVGDWKSLLSNFGGTGPVPTTDRSLLREGVVGILVIGSVGEGLENAAVAVAVKGMEGERLAAEAVVVAGGPGREGELMEEAAGAPVAGGTEGEGIGWTEGEGLLVDPEAEVSERAGAIEEDERDWACLTRFLAAALVCQPHEHGLFAEGWKNFPCRHFLIAAIAANASRFNGFCPLPSNAGRPSARSISCSAYCPRPRKWWDDFDMSEREPEIERPIATKSLPRT